MTSKANLPNRTKKARSAAQFVGVVGNGKNTTYRVPGTLGKSYRVKVRRNGVLSFQCWLEANGQDCPGNGNKHNTVCYHSIAVAEFLASGADKNIAWCANRDDAVRLSAIGGTVFRIRSHQSNGEVWGVAR